MIIIRLWLLWLAAYFIEYFAGDWYYQSDGQFYNSVISFICMIAVFSCYRTRWAKTFGSLILMQISLNAADSIGVVSEYWFNCAVECLNVLEFWMLFLIGGLTTLADWHASNSRNSGNSYRGNLGGQ